MTYTIGEVARLVEYSKVLMLDIDFAMLRCPDELFDLQAPAALCRAS